MAWDAVSGGGAPVRRGAAETAPRTAQRRTAARHGAAARGGHAAAGRAAAVLGLAAEELGQLALRWRGSAGQRYQAQAGYGDAMRRRRARAVVRCCRAKTPMAVRRDRPGADVVGGSARLHMLRPGQRPCGGVDTVPSWQGAQCECVSVQRTAARALAAT
uniref:Uncharacterized protein n=1 Tax=Oryza sativa subsp. japonica TaxID=39947 RepID=Q75KQ7_ORYSJ|nr:hypothetical protein [Oryza sativa Japonica Group]